jgi:hypothetical protein
MAHGLQHKKKRRVDALVAELSYLEAHPGADRQRPVMTRTGRVRKEGGQPLMETYHVNITPRQERRIANLRSVAIPQAKRRAAR